MAPKVIAFVVAFSATLVAGMLLNSEKPFTQLEIMAMLVIAVSSAAREETQAS